MFSEQIELRGHIIDSLLLPKVLDEIITHGGEYVIKEIRIGQRPQDQSFAKIEVRAPNAETLDVVLSLIHDHGAVPRQLSSSSSCRRSCEYSWHAKRISSLLLK